MGKTHLRVVVRRGKPYVRAGSYKEAFRKAVRDCARVPRQQDEDEEVRYWRAELVRTLQVIVEIRQHTEAREDETPLLTLGERLARRRRARDAEAKAQ